MDRITSTIAAAVAAGVPEGTAAIDSELNAFIAQAYDRLRDALADAAGGESGVMDAVTDLEADPDDEGHVTTLAHAVTAAELTDSGALVAHAEALQDALMRSAIGREALKQVGAKIDTPGVEDADAPPQGGVRSRPPAIE
jgi:hypothetical protein